MIRRAKHLNFKRIRYFFWKQTNLATQIKISFLKNFYCRPLDRLSFIIQQKFTNKNHKYYFSQNKLQCEMSFSFSVPTKKLGNSRFFLNKAVDRLMYGGYQKY